MFCSMEVVKRYTSVAVAIVASRLLAITVDVAQGECDAVAIAADNLRADIERVCPGHLKDTRKIVVRTKAGGPWESSTRTYANGVWTVTGADRRGPGAADHTGGMYWHVSYFGGPHSYTHVCCTSPGFMWYELGAKCIDNNAKETWILNVGDVKPADILIDAFGKIAWSPRDYDADAQTKILLKWAEKFVPGKDANSVGLKKRIVRHMDNYYRLGTIRKPELMAKQWVEKLTDAEKKSLMSQYIALEKEGLAIEEEFRKLPSPPLPHSSTPPLPDAWFDAFGFQSRFMAAAGRYFMSDDWLEESGKARVQSEINALCKRYDEIFDGKWKGFWFDTFPARGWDNTENGWAAQMQWPWKEPKNGRHYEATQGGDGIAESDWIDAAKFVRSGSTKDGGWAKVRGLGVSNKAMALLPVKEGAGKGAWMEYEIEGNRERGTGNGLPAEALAKAGEWIMR